MINNSDANNNDDKNEENHDDKYDALHVMGTTAATTPSDVIRRYLFSLFLLLDASMHLYERSCLSIPLWATSTKNTD